MPKCSHQQIQSHSQASSNQQMASHRQSFSHPADHSINHFIPKSLCSLSYITVDDAISTIIKYGPNILIAKVDIKNAFWLIPVHPGNRHLLAMQWNNQVYIDGCLPFSLRSAPKIIQPNGWPALLDCNSGRNTMHSPLPWYDGQRHRVWSIFHLNKCKIFD